MMKEILSNLRFLLGHWHRHRLTYSMGVLAMLATNYVFVLIPQYIQKSIDVLAGNLEATDRQLLGYIGLILALSVAVVGVRTLSRILFFNPGREVEREIKDQMYDKLTRLGRDFFAQNSTGAIISRINNDINGVRMVSGFGIMQIFNILFALTLTPYMMWQLSPRLTLYAALPVLVVFVLVRIGMMIMVRSMNARQEALQNLSGDTVAFLTGVSVIKSNEMHPWAGRKFRASNQRLLDQTLRIARVRSFVMPLLGNLDQILKVMVLLVGGLMVIREGFTIGQLTAFISYTALLAMPIMGLGWVITVFQEAFVGISSLQKVLSEPEENADKRLLPQEQAEALFRDGLEVRGLGYAYPGAEQPALSDVSFRVLPGQIVGVVGMVGSGKTTLVNCLNRYFDIPKGTVFYSGQDAALLDARSVRTVTRTVTQDVFLFSDSLENNIRFGSERFGPEQRKDLDEVVRQSALAEEVKRFDKGLETLVGEKGIMLSGGQKQRISLARALYTPTELLILDDVLSAVDNDTERQLMRAIWGNRQAKSVLIVTHRLSVLEKADNILVLDQGRVAAQGTHEQLLQSSDFYRKALELQKLGVH